MSTADTRRCERTDLYASQCACPDCRNLPDPAKTPSERGPWFYAQYAGACSFCKTGFEPGDRIRADGHGGYLGECCGEDEDDA